LSALLNFLVNLAKNGKYQQNNIENKAFLVFVLEFIGFPKKH